MSGRNQSQTNTVSVRPDGLRQAIRAALGAPPPRWAAGLMAVGLLGLTPPTLALEQVELADLDGSNGFAVNGINVGDLSGGSVSNAGDVNGDGVDDFIIGAWRADPNGDRSGQSYVVFGGNEVGSTGVLELGDLGGINGFALNGINSGDYSGSSVSGAGDVNGDGFSDVIIGAPRSGPNGDRSGQSYVVFGGKQVGSDGVIELSKLDGSNGFALNGVNAGDYAGGSVSSAGDVNGDGVADFIIGAWRADPNGEGSGQTYVVFGGQQVGSGGVLELSDLNGSNGIALNGINADDHSGVSVSGAGDVNGDEIDDLIIGAPSADPNGVNGAGQSYMVFGGNQVGSGGVVELSELDGSNGFALNGIDGRDRAGASVGGSGDVNGDGFADVVIGARFADPNGVWSGQSYVVFGGKNVGSGGVLELSDLDGNNGFALNGIGGGDRAGSSVGGSGDVNGDGFADLIIGAVGASPNGLYSGQSYVVFGGQQVGSGGVLELSDLDGSNGFALNGINSYDYSGTGSGAGDVNGDEIDDLIIGARAADPNGELSGQSYIVFGQPPAPLPLSNRTALANCLVEAGFAASAAITTSREDCEDTAGRWKVEVLVPGAEREPPLTSGSFTLFKHNKPVVRLTGWLPAQEDENLLECIVSSKGAHNALAGVPFAYAGQGAFVIDQSTLDTEAKITMGKKRHGKGRKVLKADGEKRFSAVYEDGQFAGINDAGTLTISKRRRGDDTALSTWDETSFQWAPLGYFADATAEVDDEQCTIGIQATIENAANYKLISGTWTIAESEDADVDDDDNDNEDDDGELDD